MVGHRLTITVGPASLRAVATRFRRTTWAARAAYADAADLAAALAALAAERPSGLAAALVVLDAPLARCKTVDALPALSQADLAAHVRLNSRRYFLQNGVPLVTDALPRPEHRAALAAAPLPLVTAVCDGLAAGGLVCVNIVPASEPSLCLLPERLRAARSTSRRAALARWAIIATASAILAVISRSFALIHDERSARGELARLRTPVAEALAVRRDLDQTTAALHVLALASGPAQNAEWLATLARTLPDSAFLGTLRLEAAHAAAVPAALERADLMSTPAFEGPVTREVVNGRELERFTLQGRQRTAVRDSAP